MYAPGSLFCQNSGVVLLMKAFAVHTITCVFNERYVNTRCGYIREDYSNQVTLENVSVHFTKRRTKNKFQIIIIIVERIFHVFLSPYLPDWDLYTSV